MRTSHTSTVFATAALTGVALLTGCSAQASADACEPTFRSGALSEHVSVLGEFGTEPTVNIDESFTYGGAQAQIIHRAADRSEAITGPSVVSLNYMIVESGTNEVMASSASFSNGVGNDLVPVNPGPDQSVFPGGLECAAPGDRVVLTLAPEEVAAITGTHPSASSTAYAFVVDVHDVQPVALDGKARVLPAGFPGVVRDDTGQPGVIATPNDPPSETRAAASIEGDGPEITEDSFVVGNVLQVTWDGWRQTGNQLVREPIRNTFPTGPVEIGAAEGAQLDMREALNGFTVGSEVVVITPDEEYGATVWVVDILSGS